MQSSAGSTSSANSDRRTLLASATRLLQALSKQLEEMPRLRTRMAELSREASAFEQEVLEDATTMWQKLSRMERAFDDLRHDNRLYVSAHEDLVGGNGEDGSARQQSSESERSVSRIADTLVRFGRESSTSAPPRKPVYGVVEMTDRFESVADNLDGLIASLDSLRAASSIVDGLERSRELDGLDLDRLYFVALQSRAQLRNTLEAAEVTMESPPLASRILKGPQK